jgi:hypothetical protein
MHRQLRLLAAAAFLAHAARAEDAEGWVNLFNGKDLSNWVNVNCAPETWRVDEGVIKSTGKPTGALRTSRMYENFVMEVEWRHMTSGGNAGIFIWASPIAAKGVPFLRAIEVQVLDHGYGNTESYTTHGDVFPIHGSTMDPFGKHHGMRSFPSEQRSKPSPEWNHYRIEGNQGVLRLSVNGKEVSGGEKCNWRKGYIGLESEGAPTEWRMVKIKDLPSSNAPFAESAPEAQGHRPLYNGLDLRGWQTTTPDRWKPSDWQLQLKGGDPGAPLWSDAEFGDADLIFDVKVKKKSEKDPAILLGKAKGEPARLSLAALAGGGDTPPDQDLGVGKWHRVMLTLKAGAVTMTLNGKPVLQQDLPATFAKQRSLGLEDTGAELTFANFYLRDL